jgi:serine kinase of HPr protein (carbohydrate metabolism regulator)
MSADEPRDAPTLSGKAPRVVPEEEPLEHRSGTRLRLHPGGKGPRSATSQSLHATCVVIRESGILIRGASGAGKTSFALLLLAQARAAGEFAAWVGDDRVLVSRHANRLIAAAHPAIAGRFEARGLGILSETHEARAVLRLLVDLEDYTERLPERGELTGMVASVALPRLPLVAGRVGLYEASLVVSLVRKRQEKESRPTPSSRVGTVGI